MGSSNLECQTCAGRACLGGDEHLVVGHASRLVCLYLGTRR
jgi:hypothetical protein